MVCVKDFFVLIVLSVSLFQHFGTVAFQVIQGQYKQTRLDITSRLSGCPAITLKAPNVYECAAWCSLNSSCYGFRDDLDQCSLYPFVISPAVPGAVGSIRVYTKLSSNSIDVARFKLITGGTVWAGNNPIATITYGYACMLDNQNCWCSKNKTETFVIDLVHRATVSEVVFTVPIGSSYDFSGVTVYIGDVGSKADPIFTSKPPITPLVGDRLSVVGTAKTGRYITIESLHPFKVLCLCLFEAYGYYV